VKIATTVLMYQPLSLEKRLMRWRGHRVAIIARLSDIIPA
jgi:hypothetical protein